MKMNKQFCSKCMKMVDCKYDEGIIKEVIDSVEIEYLEKYYVCELCGSKIYGDLLNYNISTANNELRKHTGLITVDEIEEISKKYNIGKKPLSLVLGLGEVTLTRYLKGVNPSKENSELLKSILNNPILYEMYLIVHKDNITQTAYKKSLGKTKQIEFVEGKSKIYNVALYIISKLKEVDSLALQKIMYFANLLSNNFLGSYLINEESESWKYGPVYRDIYECFSYYGYNKIDYEELLKDNKIDLSDDERKYLDTIISDFGYYSGGILREMTHLTDPWINTRIGLDNEEYSNRKISFEELDKYFKKISKKYNFKTIDDISKYSLDLFEKAKENLQ